ncbi:hypothetical protein GWI33_020967 [Rhynchophorus ferrugineus]|uniref:Uncharacterized protein n=1 Tax=Rhynchophorus ferrugineus TaxID=354439 RepID=A0A834LYZ9_RHYFE|nr:hypothetical protein GWI33_020967 [Rhynchophorus ferrugineus]
MRSKVLETMQGRRKGFVRLGRDQCKKGDPKQGRGPEGRPCGMAEGIEVMLREEEAEERGKEIRGIFGKRKVYLNRGESRQDHRSARDVVYFFARIRHEYVLVLFLWI